MSQDSIKSLMNTMVISVLPETPILTAIDIILSNDFNGIPVTDTKGALVGILTKFDLIAKRSSMTDDTIVKDVMNTDPLFLNEGGSVEDAEKAFSEHHKVDPIPVVNPDRRVVGVISRYDMVKMFRGYDTPLSSSSKNQQQQTATPSASPNRIPLVWLYIVIFTLIGFLVGYLVN